MKKPKVPGKKLTLDKETLRTLQADELEQAAGGTFTKFPSVVCSVFCPRLPTFVPTTNRSAC